MVPRDGREVVGTLDLKPKPPGSFFFEGHYCYSSLKKKKVLGRPGKGRKWLLLKSQSRLLGGELAMSP